jgi:hypothetical protein
VLKTGKPGYSAGTAIASQASPQAGCRDAPHHDRDRRDDDRGPPRSRRDERALATRSRSDGADAGLADLQRPGLVPMGPFTRATFARLSFLTAAAVVASAATAGRRATDGSGAGRHVGLARAASTSGSGSGSSTGSVAGADRLRASLRRPAPWSRSILPRPGRSREWCSTPPRDDVRIAEVRTASPPRCRCADALTLRSQNDDATASSSAAGTR